MNVSVSLSQFLRKETVSASSKSNIYNENIIRLKQLHLMETLHFRYIKIYIKIWDPVRTKILIGIKIIEQVTLFNYLGNISYERKLDIDNKLNNYLKITGI
jgi:hypothetical protein